LIGDAELSQLVGELNQLGDLNELQRKLRIGQLVFERVYGGELDALERRGQNHSSFRRLARRADLAVSVATVFRATKLYIVAQHMDVDRVQRLRVGHFYAVSGLPLPEQVALLDEAEQRGTEVAELRRLVAKRRIQDREPRPGRNPLQPAIFRLRHLGRSVRACVSELGEHPSFSTLDPDERREAERILLEASAWIGRPLRALGAETRLSPQGPDVHPARRRRDSGVRAVGED
jgi:hypothetical protein